MRYNSSDNYEYYKIDKIVETQFMDLVRDLQAPRFSKNKYSQRYIENWLLTQYEQDCEEQEFLVEHIARATRSSLAMPEEEYGRLWHKIIVAAFELCKSEKAKKAVLNAIVSASISEDSGLLVKQAVPFLYETIEQLQRGKKQEIITIFSGNYDEDDYSFTTLIAAAQCMLLGNKAANEHIKKWLQSISLPGGTLPSRNSLLSISDKSIQDTWNSNQVLWQDVIIPFCRKNPGYNLLSEKSVVYLPVEFGNESSPRLIKALTTPHQQQWAYSNVMMGKNNKGALEFWEQACSQDIFQSTRDFRLQLALVQLIEDDAALLARKIDMPMVIMLETLGEYSTATMAEMLYSRWLNADEEKSELPLDFYDAETLGF